MAWGPAVSARHSGQEETAPRAQPKEACKRVFASPYIDHRRCAVTAKTSEGGENFSGLFIAASPLPVPYTP